MERIQNQVISRALLDGIPDAVYVIDPETSKIVDCNRHAHEDLQLTRDQVLEHSVLSLQTGVHGLPAWSEIAAVIRAQAPYRFIGSHLRADGTELPVEVNTDITWMDGREYFISIARDIRRQSASGSTIAPDGESWQVLYDLANGVWDWRIESGALYFSPALKSLLGYGPDEMEPVLATWKANVHPDDVPAVLASLEDHLQGKRHLFEAVYRLRNRNGHFIWVHDRGQVVEWNDAGQPARAVGMVHDVTDAKAIEQSLQNLAERDSLTGLYNRRRGMELYEEAFAAVRRQNRNLALLILDLDHFKGINDQFGHLVGDDILRWIGAAILSCMPAAGIGFRWGGEEFVVALPNLDESEASDLAEQIRVKLSERTWPELSPGFRITASAGIAVYPQQGEDPNALIVAADRALYEAKRAGRDCIVHAPVMSDSV